MTDFIPNLDLTKEIEAKLASVGLPADAFPILTNIETAMLPGATQAAVAIKIPYYALPDSQKDPRRLTPINVARYRFFTAEDVKLDRRYTQLFSSPIDTYIPPNLDLNKFYDRSELLYITEGELKAHAALSYGYQCIGLPGIDSFYFKDQQALHPQLNKIPVNKTVVIVFDTEVEEKEEITDANGDIKKVTKENSAFMSVIRAKNKLAACLMVRGIKVKHITLPVERGKIQLDEYLLLHGVLPEPKPFEFNKKDSKAALRVLQSEFAVIDGKFFDVSTTNALAMGPFGVQYANMFIKSRSGKAKPAAKVMPADVYTLKLKQLAYLPEYPNRVPSPGVYNMFSGWGTNVAKDNSVDLTPFHEVMAMLFDDEEDILAEYYKTIAFMLQKPWVKQHRFLLFRGSAQGVGKSFTLDIPLNLINGKDNPTSSISLNHAMSDNCGKSTLDTQFNSLLSNKSYVTMSEVADVGKKNTVNELKALVTEPFIQIQKKFLDSFMIRNCLLLSITSNERRLFEIDEASRRPLVLPCIEANTEREREIKAMWARNGKKFHDWFGSKPTQEALMKFFMDYDIGDYDGTQACPVSRGQMQLTEDNKSDLAVFMESEFNKLLVIPRLEFQRFSLNSHLKHLNYGAFLGTLRSIGYVHPNCDRTWGQVAINKTLLDKYDVKAKLNSLKPNTLVKEEAKCYTREHLNDLIEEIYLKEGKV